MLVIGLMIRKIKRRPLHPRMSTHRANSAKSADGKNVDKVLDDFILRESLNNRVNKVEEIEEYKSRPHKSSEV